ncbi:hypothetical protein [Neisseria yangbaofengii]|uniref:hypothetical protein n=1 Tax=Neisseria yangbaofengii TaxID=2709396 RepID=UPI0013EBB585|nr:hypothetical protein [Neisseria yangbaofengii]
MATETTARKTADNNLQAAHDMLKQMVDKAVEDIAAWAGRTNTQQMPPCWKTARCVSLWATAAA